MVDTVLRSGNEGVGFFWNPYGYNIRYQNGLSLSLNEQSSESPLYKTIPVIDFLGIGVQKGGTTLLYEQLKKVEEIFLPKQKELHFLTGRKIMPGGSTGT
jgi:hypothetical protein